MAFLHRNKNSATGSADFSSSAQRSLDSRAVICDIDDSGGKKDGIVCWRWPQHFDRIFGGHSAWGAILFRVLHQMIRCRPVAMAIEQRADDAAIQDPSKRFVFFLGFPFSDHFAIFWKTSDMQSIWVRRATTPANVVRSVFFLERLVTHLGNKSGGIASITIANALRTTRSTFVLMRRRRWTGPDRDAFLDRCKVSAAGSDDCYRVAR